MTLALARQPVAQAAAPTQSRRSWRARLKDALFISYLYSGWPQLRDAWLRWRGEARAVIVTYHRVGGCDVLSRPVVAFRADVAYFQRHFDVVTLAELTRRLQGPRRRPCLAITFDDGYRDNFTQAAPILEEAGVRGTFFVTTGFVGTERVFPHDARGQDENDPGVIKRFPKLTWQDVRAMAEVGHEIGAHTVNHVNLGRAAAVEVEIELEGALVDLQRELDVQPRAFAFPWGKPGDVGSHALALLRRIGYYAAVTAHGGENATGADPLQLHRIDVGNGHLSQWAVRARVRGLDLEGRRHQRSRKSS